MSQPTPPPPGYKGVYKTPAKGSNPPASNQAAASNQGATYSQAQLQQLLSGISGIDPTALAAFLATATATATAPATAAPTVKQPNFGGTFGPRSGYGGTNTHGVWTGKGKHESGLAPMSYNCYRNLNLGNKTLKELHLIEEACKKGLSDTPEKHFGLVTEKGPPLTASIQALETFVIDHGLEPAFQIIQHDGTVLNMLQNYGRLTSSIIDTWCNDALVLGVHDGKGGRLPTCKYDGDNFGWSAKTILNSCTDLMRDTIERAVPAEQRNGPRCLFYVLQNSQTTSHAMVRHHCNELENMDIRKIPGENMETYARTALMKVEEISKASLSPVYDLCQLCLKGVTLSSDEGLRSEARELLRKADQDVGTMTPQNVMTLLVQSYRSAVDRKVYGPARSIAPSKEMQALQAQVTAVAACQHEAQSNS